MTSEHAEEWRQAMDDEMASLAANNTWTLERVPEGVKPIPVKWVYFFWECLLHVSTFATTRVALPTGVKPG
jgi:hypothetical protein